MEKHMPVHHHPGFIRKNAIVEKSYCQIDPKLQRLATCMNTCGMKTYASCQGSGFPVRKRLPCVIFTAPAPGATPGKTGQGRCRIFISPTLPGQGSHCPL
ncbi:hypothetical protein IH92_12625 [Salmonella enterica]|nr:hypothetical protein [Salmonella enterica]